MEKLLVSVLECSEVLGIAKSHVYELVRQGQIPSIHFGRRVLIPRKCLEEYIADKTRREQEDRSATY